MQILDDDNEEIKWVKVERVKHFPRPECPAFYTRGRSISYLRERFPDVIIGEVYNIHFNSSAFEESWRVVAIGSIAEDPEPGREWVTLIPTVFK
jgi:hypothetical protein